MLVSYNWLNEYVDLGEITPQELAEKITRSGIEVEIVEALNKGVKGVVIGKVVECNQHPNADKLNLCQVDIGDDETVQIICGASNVAAGQKVAVAKVGAVLPGNFKIKKAKLRGEPSNGMICSLQELGIEGKLVPKEYSDGIFVLPNQVHVGEDALEYLNLDDHVLELGLTPNRADCLNMIGVAYEVAAILSVEPRLPDVNLIESTEVRAKEFISVNIESLEDNPYYGAKVIKNIKVKPSPLWLQNRLISAGIRPHNNVVDVTNYVLLEYGQPLHAFDYDRFDSKEVLIRRAKAGETIVTLDDEERELTEEHLVITNGKGPVAVAGVMGGADSEVREDTTTVLLEAAYFNGVRVRKASRALGIRSEASARYEKGIDRNRVFEAAERAAALLVELADGEIASGIVEAGVRFVDTYTVSVSQSRINQVLGTKITDTEINSIFKRLKFEVTQSGDVFDVEVPTRRPDITIDADLIEEVGRIYGYDRIPSTLPVGQSTPGQLTTYQRLRRKVRKYLEGISFDQAVTYSLTTETKANIFNWLSNEPSYISVAMPMSEERSTLRRTIIPQLLEAVRYNLNRQNENISFYEIGSTYFTDEKQLKNLPIEREKLAGVLTGQWLSHEWQGEQKQVDFFVAKGVLEELFELLGLDDRVSYNQSQINGFHPGRTATISLDGAVIGIIGQIHPAVQKDWDLNETYAFEFDLQTVLNAEVDSLSYQTLPRYPSITRDIALVVAEEVAAGDVLVTINEAGGKLLKETRLFDLYQGEHMEEGKKSIAFSLKYFDPERTLTDEEVTKAHNKVLQAVSEQYGAELRS
jgi:phenylalanyl-tRNA synthetase beta chain